MAKKSVGTSTASSYAQMMARRQELKSQSPWLEDYELNAFLTDEGYDVFAIPDDEDLENFNDNASELNEYSYNSEYGEGIDIAEEWSEEAAQSAYEAAEAEYDQAHAALQQSLKEEQAAREKEENKPKLTKEQEKKAREVREKARKLLSKTIGAETEKMGIALTSFIVFQFLITTLLTSYLLLVAGYKKMEINNFLSDPINMLILQGVILIVGLGLPFMLYIMVLKMPLREAVPFREVKPGIFIRMVLIGLGLCVGVRYIYNVIELETFVTGGLTNSQIVLAEQSGVGLVLSILVLCVLPAILEEFVFRGVILQVLRRRGGDLFAIVMSAILCGLIYSNVRSIESFLIGLLMGYLVVFSGSLLPSIVINLLRSALSLTVTLLATKINPVTLSYIDCGATLFLLIIGLLALPGMFRRFPDFCKVKQGNSTLTLKEKLTTAMRRPSIVFLVIYAVFFTILEMIPTDTLIDRWFK